MAGITAVKRIGFAGGGRDASKSDFRSSRTRSPGHPSNRTLSATTNRATSGGDRDNSGPYVTKPFRDSNKTTNQTIKTTPKEKKKLNIPSFKDMYDGYNKFRYNTVNSLIPGQKERIQKYRTAYAKYLKDQGIQVPGNLLDEDLSSYFFDGAFDKNQITDPRPSMRPDHMDYGTFMATKMGSPGIKYAGNVGGLGDKYVTKRDEITGKPLEYGYTNIDDGGNLILGKGEGGGQNYLPLNYGVGGGDEEEETQTFEFDPSRFGAGAEAADVTRASYIFNQGGRVPRAFGGIMDTATGRKRYFLGSVGDAIGDVFGGVAKAAGKVLKSDLGKAAIAGAAFYYGGGGGMPKFLGGKGLGGFSPTTFFSKSNPLLFSANKAGEQVFNPLKFAGLITAGGAAMGPAKIDQMPDGYGGGKMIDPLTKKEGTPASMRENIELAKLEAAGDPDKLDALNRAYNNMLFTTKPYENYGLYANGGRIARAEGGLMNLGGMEKDYRAEGGFVPIGKAEKADDVPARLSVNEFVFTADAVRNAGGGDIDKGAEVMENMMKNLENGGRVSEESQGNTGAQEMFSVSERIGEVI